MKTKQIASPEAAIWKRLIRPDKKVSEAEARALLQWDFDDADRARMRELAEKNRDDDLTDQERAELQGYINVGLFLDLIHAKANRSLRRR